MNGVQDTTFSFTTDALNDMMTNFSKDNLKYDSVFLYFARFNKNQAPNNFPNLKDNEVICLFSVDRKNYYFIYDSNVSPVSTPQWLDSEIFTIWRRGIGEICQKERYFKLL